MNLLLWACCLATTTAVTFGLYSARSHTTFVSPAYSVFEAACYNGLAKLAWGAALGWVAFACARGHGGVVDSLLGWGFFKPLARINYLTYLVHGGFIAVFYCSLTYSVEFTDIIAVSLPFPILTLDLHIVNLLERSNCNS